MRSQWANRTILNRLTAPLLSAAALLVACNRDKEPTAPATPNQAQDRATANVPELLKTRLERFSGMPMLLTARQLGVSTIQGKEINSKKGDKGKGPKKLDDVAVANDPVAHENEPSVATNPKKKKLLVAGEHNITNEVRCEARHSSDGGRSWSEPFFMPQLTAASQCSDPVLAYAPDGSRVFYAYMDVKFFGPPTFFSEFDVIVSYSDDDGDTWTGPFLALDGVAGAYDYDKPWIGTPDDEANIVYVTATRFDAVGAGDCHIAFTRSTNGGTVYEGPQFLDESTAGCGFGASPVVQGSRPAGGKHGNVLVAWFHSGFDGWLNGSFIIRTRHSADFGVTFEPIVDAATDASELNFFKGPFFCYERWWGGMFPDVELDPGGGGHLAYTHDPEEGFATAEEGDIRYASSDGPPYTSWSPPVTVNDDASGHAQGYVALDVKAEGTGQSAQPHAIWMDGRLGTAPDPECDVVANPVYDIYYSTLQGGRWSPNVRVSDESSRSDFFFVGDYNDLTPTNGGLFGIWTDRRDKTTIFDFEDDVYGSLTHRVH